jgi:hypothetical protein
MEGACVSLIFDGILTVTLCPRRNECPLIPSIEGFNLLLPLRFPENRTDNRVSSPPKTIG